MLLMGKAEYRDFHVDQVQYDYQLFEELHKLPFPRVLQSHLPKMFQPQQFREKKPRIVHVYRNPKAIAVSFYHLMNEVEHLKTMASMDASIEIVNKYWPRFMDGIAEFMREIPELPIFHISYEAMIANPQQTVKKLADFLETGASDDLCCQIQEACSFDKQKSIEDKLNSEANVKGVMFRKGGTENWKTYMTVAQSEILEDMLRERRNRCMFSTKYI